MIGGVAASVRIYLPLDRRPYRRGPSCRALPVICRVFRQVTPHPFEEANPAVQRASNCRGLANSRARIVACSRNGTIPKRNSKTLNFPATCRELQAISHIKRPDVSRATLAADPSTRPTDRAGQQRPEFVATVTRVDLVKYDRRGTSAADGLGT